MKTTKIILLALILAMSVARSAMAASSPAAPKPNIVHELTDDLGWTDPACYYLYKLGDNLTAWHHFPLHDDSDLVIDGNGATLLCSHGNLGFHFNGGRNITVRGLVFDTIVPAFTSLRLAATALAARLATDA